MTKHNLDAELAALHIPIFKYPWPEACSPHVELIEKRTLEWAGKFGLLISDQYRERVARSRYGWFAARCYPNAGSELLQATADMFLWLFVVDDLFVDRVETLTPDTLPNLTAMIDVLELGCVSSQPVFGELAWFDLCRRLRKLLGNEPFERFAHGIRLWATASGLQIVNHLQSESVKIRSYQTIRRHTSGMNPCLCLADATNGGSMDANEFWRPDVQKLVLRANNIVCWSNDIHSLIVEARQPGQFRNMVVIRAMEGYTLQESVDYTAACVNAEISEFVRLCDTMMPSAGARLCGFIEGLKYWIRGYQDWAEKDTLRYAAEFAVDDADDRGILSNGVVIVNGLSAC